MKICQKYQKTDIFLMKFHITDIFDTFDDHVMPSNSLATIKI